MLIIGQQKLGKVCQKYPKCRSAIEAWVKLGENSDWNSFADVKASSIFSPDSVKGRVVFDIRGNKYRLITQIDYKCKRIYIRDFLTHVEYDKGDWKND